jgi:hypothetical protein
MNISGNNSWSDESLHIFYKPWEITLCAFILTFGLVANVMLLIAQWKDPLRCFGTISTCFIQHIAIIDCLGLLVFCSVLVIACGKNEQSFLRWFESRETVETVHAILHCVSQSKPHKFCC